MKNSLFNACRIGWVFLFCCLVLQVQGQRDSQELTERIAKAKLLLIKFEKEKELLISKARSLNFPLIQRTKSGNLYYLKEIINNHPYYEGLYNVDSQITSSAYNLKPNRGSGYDLNGNGVKIGVWDGGKVRETHQEFQSRVMQIDTNTILNDHMTHVAGTIGAAGINPDVEGFSSKATLRCFSGRDDIIEMTSEQMLVDPIVVSNHSYGSLPGWTKINGIRSWVGDLNVSNQEDWLFGAYTASSRAFDQLAYDFKYYLIVRAAGNDFGESGPSQGPHIHGIDTLTFYTDFHPNDGANGYDCLPNTGTGKNILTIGAIEEIPGGYSQPSDVVRAPFSSTGPADDGRIKPDLVAQGRLLLSTGIDSDTDVYLSSGTSMSAPSVTGALGLLYQQWKNYFGNVPRSATMKGIAIHTADEAGSDPGPDYHFGWGLMNTERAADLIALHSSNECKVITEDVLSAGNTVKTYSFHSDGMTPIRATLIWNDIPGSQINTGVLDPTFKNLNVDFDLTIVANGTTTYYPYILDPNNPSAPATTGRNNTDNVEQIFISNPTPGSYQINVSIPTALFENFQFTLITTGFNTQNNDVNVIDEQITSNKVYGASGSIKASGRTFVLNGSRTEFIAADSITFLPDFEVTPRSYVIARLGRACSVD